MESICKQCGQPFVCKPKQGRRQKYCSPACRITYWSKSRGHATGGTVVCEVCGTPFQYERLYFGATPKYCSDACRVQGERVYHAAYDATYRVTHHDQKLAKAQVYQATHRDKIREWKDRYAIEHKDEIAAKRAAKRAANYKPNLVTLTCPTCGISFEHDEKQKGQTNRRYCSDACSQKARETKHAGYVANYYARNRDKYRTYNAEYARIHREEINARTRLYDRARREAKGIKPRLAARIEYRNRNQVEGGDD